MIITKKILTFNLKNVHTADNLSWNFCQEKVNLNLIKETVHEKPKLEDP